MRTKAQADHAWYISNKKKKLAYLKEYQAKNKDKIRAYWKEYYLKKKLAKQHEIRSTGTNNKQLSKWLLESK